MDPVDIEAIRVKLHRFHWRFLAYLGPNPAEPDDWHDVAAESMIVGRCHLVNVSLKGSLSTMYGVVVRRQLGPVEVIVLLGSGS
jgi:hypothetical protein